MATIGDVFLRLLADDKGFERNVVASGAKAGDKAGQTLGARLKNALSPKNLAVAGMAGAAAGIGLFAAGIGQAVKDLIRIEQLGAQTDAVLRSTGGAANVTREEVDGLSQSMEKLTGIEAESITEGQNLLLTFTNLRNETGEGNAIFDRATEAMVDYSVAMGTDAKGGAIQLGKALNDPIKGITALGRAGVQFSDEQKKMIKGFVETGDLLSAQKIILDELETQFGGSAEAFGNTTAGKIAKFQNDVGNMFESIVLGAVEVSDKIGGAADGVGDFFNSLATQSGGQAATIESNASRLGVSVETMRDRILRAQDEQNLSFEDATNVAVSEMTEMQAGAFNTYTAVATAAAEGMATTVATTHAGAADIAAAIPEAVTANWENIRQAGVDTQLAYNQGIFDSQDAFKAEIDALLARLDSNLTPGEEIAYLRGKKIELWLARGVAEEKGDAGAVAAIDDMIADINSRLNGLNGYSAGKNLVVTLANGIRQNLGTASLASAALAGIIRGPVFIESEPKDPNSPLRGITKVGGNIVKTIADDIYANLGTGANAAHALAASLVPGFGTPAFADGAPAAGGGSTVQYILQVDGREPEVGTRDDILDRWEQMARLSDRSLFG